jgi:hypothetical protein
MRRIVRGTIDPHWTSQQLPFIEYVQQENVYRGFQTTAPTTQEFVVNMNIHQGLHGVFDESVLARYFNWLDHRVYAVHCMHPGCALPEHTDKYPYYSKTHNLQDINHIHRVIIFLEDKKPGHRFTMQGEEMLDWKAGDWVTWCGSTVHGAYNEGTQNRYTLQITGVPHGINP